MRGVHPVGRRPGRRPRDRLQDLQSEVSRICACRDEVITAFRNRRLDHTEFPYVYLDASDFGRFRSRAAGYEIDRLGTFTRAAGCPVPHRHAGNRPTG